MYGTQPAEQWKTVVQTNDPRLDRYGLHRKDGHKAWFPGNQFPSTWAPVINHSGMKGWMDGCETLGMKAVVGEENGGWGSFPRWIEHEERTLLVINWRWNYQPSVHPSHLRKNRPMMWSCSLATHSAWWLFCWLRLRFKELFSNWFTPTVEPINPNLSLMKEMFLTERVWEQPFLCVWLHVYPVVVGLRCFCVTNYLLEEVLNT